MVYLDEKVVLDKLEEAEEQDVLDAVRSGRGRVSA